jgi:hypothetical protein
MARTSDVNKELCSYKQRVLDEMASIRHLVYYVFHKLHSFKILSLGM